MILTRQEKEKMVLELHRQSKGTREIAQELKMSFSSIGAILRKEVQQKELAQERVETRSVSTQAYSLFSRGKTVLEVAIELGLEADEAIRHQKEFWKLKQLDDLGRLYDELNGSVWAYLKLYRLSLAAGMNTPQVISLLRIANNELPRVESVIESSRVLLDSLKLNKQDIENQIFNLHGTLTSYRTAIRDELDRINQLQQKRIRLEQVVHHMDQKYIKIESSVRQVVEGVLERHRQLLGFALRALVESLRKDPRKLPILYYNLSSGRSPNYDEFPLVNTLLDDGSLSEETSEEKLLLDESAAIYDSMVKELTNKTIVEMISGLELPSSVSAFSKWEKNKEGPALEDRSEEVQADYQEYWPS